MMPQATVTKLGQISNSNNGEGQYRYVHFDGADKGIAVSTKDPCWKDAMVLKVGDVVKYETRVNGKYTNLLTIDVIGKSSTQASGGAAAGSRTTDPRNSSIEAQVLLKASVELLVAGKVADMKEAAGVVQAIFDMHRQFLANPDPAPEDIPF
jgi:hypothetical protein